MNEGTYSSHGGEDHDLFFRLRAHGLFASRMTLEGFQGGLVHQSHEMDQAFLTGLQAKKETCARPWENALHNIKDYDRRADW